MPYTDDLSRLHRIVSILIRYGFGDAVRRMGLANILERAGQALHWQDAHEYAHLAPPARARRAMEELGPTFVKLGQVLATRVDILEPEWIAEFSKLQSSVPPVPYEAVRAQLCEDLGAAPEQVFACFNPVPFAAGSIAQVHSARLHEGDEVIVKVRRPGIRQLVEADLRWLMKLAQIADGDGMERQTVSRQEVVRQFARSLRNELDFANECRIASRIAENFSGYTDQEPGETSQQDSDQSALEAPIVIPRVYWQWCSERVCVQEYIAGIPGQRIDELEAAGLDRKILARRGARAVLKMILQDGLFHADPHPGNLFYLPGNRIAFIDFGMVGRLSEQRRRQLTHLLLGLARQEADRVTDVLQEWTDEQRTTQNQLSEDIENFIDQYRGVPLKRLRFGAMLTDLVSILRLHHLSLPADLTLLVKAFVSLEGVGRGLDPDFDISREALPVLERALRERYASGVLLRRLIRDGGSALSTIADLPRAFSRLVKTMQRGRIDVQVEVRHLRRVGSQLDRASNRLTVGIVVAALIIGSSIVMTVPGGPSLFGLPLFGLLGFLGAVAGSLWLLLSIGRSGKQDREMGD